MKIFLIGMCLLVFVSKAQAQKQKERRLNGVYLTLDDYLHRHLTHSFFSKTKGHHLRFSGKSHLKLITPDSVYVYDLNRIYGYCEDGSNWCYRNGDLVEIIGYYSPGFISFEGLWLYRRRDWFESGTTYTYYFTKKPTGDLVWLTKKKFRKAYQDDTAFLQLISKVRWVQLLYDLSEKGQPLLLEMYATAHQPDFNLIEE
ncbi:MAG: hypothetical protein U0X91_03630 [Spirosomataceae bacterium]